MIILAPGLARAILSVFSDYVNGLLVWPVMTRIPLIILNFSSLIKLQFSSLIKIKYCKSNTIYTITISTIISHSTGNGLLGTPTMGDWEPHPLLKFLTFVRLRSYAVTRLRVCYCINKYTRSM